METPTRRQLPALGKKHQIGIPINSWDFPGSPVAETLRPVQGPWVRSLVRELDLMPQLRVHMPPLKILYAVMKIEDPGCCK